MKLFAISDLHLAKSISKPMDIFGGDWEDYMERTEMNWLNTVGRDDYVIIPGDISWATYLEQTYEDFLFLESLPGMKIVAKGNHDYWWTSMKKLTEYVQKNKFSSISFLHNNSYDFGEVAVCGARGWKFPWDETFEEADKKIYERELQRLEMSLASVKDREGKTIVAALHFPPVDRNGRCSGFAEIMADYGVKTCIYGHLHGNKDNTFEGMHGGIDYRLVSADHLSFTPFLLYEL